MIDPDYPEMDLKPTDMLIDRSTVEELLSVLIHQYISPDKPKVHEFIKHALRFTQVKK